MEEKNSIVIFKNWIEAINTLPKRHQLKTYKALIEYCFTGQIPNNINQISKSLLISFSIGVKNNIQRYNASVENGKKGGRPKRIEQENKNLEKPNSHENTNSKNLEKPNIDNFKNLDNLEKPNQNLKDNDNVNDKDISLSINKNNLSERVRACESVEGLISIYQQYFKDYFSYWGYSDEDKKIFNEVLNILSEATLKAKNNQLRFYQMKYDLNLLIQSIKKLDEQDIRDIVWQVMNNKNIRDRNLYILGALLSRASEKQKEAL